MAAWVQDIKVKSEGESILEYNAQEDLEFRRWRLQNDPDSEASQDLHYISAFTDRPIQMWRGEPGVLILRNVAILETPLTPDIDTELKEALDTYDELRKIWTRFDKPCPKGECRICNYEGSNSDVDGSEEDEGDKEEDGGDQENEKDEEDEEDEEDREDQNYQEDRGNQKDREDEKNGGGRTSLKAQNTTHQNRLNSTNRSRHGMARNAIQKENKPN